MKVPAIYMVAALMWLAAAVLTYVSDPEDWAKALMWLGLAGLFAAIGFAQKRPRS